MANGPAASVVGPVAVYLHCPVMAPEVGDVICVAVFGRRLLFEVLKVAEYRKPLELEDGTLATHFVRAHRREAYLEE